LLNLPEVDPYTRRVVRLRASRRWRQQVAALTSLQLVELSMGVLAGLVADDAATTVPTLATHRAAEKHMVRALALFAEAKDRHPKIQEKTHDA
jgi:hypothetical protein